ncbi:MAG: DUF2147 domain-containing protein [Sphingomonadaceae bacterium]
MRAMLALGVAVLGVSSTAAEPELSPYGLWRNPSGSVEVRIETCGAKVCGRVVSASERARADAARGGHAELVGMDLLEEFRREGPRTFRGRVFVPDINRRFSGKLTIQDEQHIRVRGCITRTAGCRSQVWTRVG